MKKLILLVCLLSACGQDIGINGPDRSVFSYWDGMGSTLDLRDAEYDTPVHVTLQFELTQDWIDYLASDGYGTSGLSPLTKTTCYYYTAQITVQALDETSGYMLYSAGNGTDTTSGACLFLDNTCDDGLCRDSAKHYYEISGNIMTIKYFDGSDIDIDDLWVRTF